MSEAAYDLSKELRRRCQSCAERKARFRYRGVVKADRDHTLCFECFRAERDRRRARLLAAIPPASTLGSAFEGQRVLTPVQVQHRWRMLAHLKTATSGRRKQ